MSLPGSSSTSVFLTLYQVEFHAVPGSTKVGYLLPGNLYILVQLRQIKRNPNMFFRAHRSAIVNLTRIKEIIPWLAGSHRIRLITGAEVDLSRSQAKELRKIIQW